MAQVWDNQRRRSGLACKQVLFCSKLSSRSGMGACNLSLYFSNRVFHTPDQFHSTEVQNALCAPRGVFCSKGPSVTRYTLTKIKGSNYLFIYVMNPALQGLVQRSRRLARGNLKAVHLKSNICICQFLHYFGLFFTFDSSTFTFDSSTSLFSGLFLKTGWESWSDFNSETA